MTTLHGSQRREPYQEAGYRLVALIEQPDDIRFAILETTDGKRELWALNDHFAGYVLDINGLGYEFVRSHHGPIRFSPDPYLSCDECGLYVLNWPIGLYTADREYGIFAGTSITCPGCVQRVHFAPSGRGTVGLLRQGVKFAQLDWFWYEPRE